MEVKEYLKKKRKRKLFIMITQIIILSIFLISWEILSNKKIINPFIFSSPSRIINTISNLIIENNFWIHLKTTLIEIIVAFTLGISLGFIISLILYEVPYLYQILEPFLTMLNSLPKVALGPMIIIWVGANTKSIIVMALLINLIICILNIYNGFQNTDKIKIKLMKSFKATKLDILKYLVIPSSINNIVSSFKICISMTLIGVVMGEFLVSQKGLGYLIIYGTQVFNLNLVMSGITLLVILSYIIYKLITILENKLIRK